MSQRGTAEGSSVPVAQLAALLAAAGFALALVSLWTSRVPGSVAGLWLPNVLGVVLLAWRAPRHWALLLASLLLGIGAAGLVYGDPPALLLRFLAINGFEVLVGAGLLRHFSLLQGGGELKSASWWRACGWGVLVPTAVGALLAGLWVAPALQMPALRMAEIWFLSASTGGLTLLGAVLLWQAQAFETADARARAQWVFAASGIAVVLLAAALTYWLLQVEPFRFIYVAVLALAAAVLLPARDAQAAIAAASCVFAWGVSSGYAGGDIQKDQLALNYLTHLLIVLPAMWVSLERRDWAAAREATEAIIEATPNGIVVLSPQGRVVRINQRAAALLRRGPAELLGGFWEPHYEGAPQAVHTVPGPKAAAPQPPLAARMRRGDGSFLDVELTATHYFNAARERQTLIVFHDVSVRRMQERSAQDALQRLERLAVITPGVLTLLRLQPDGRMCMPWQSPQAPALWGLPNDVLAEDATLLFEHMAPEVAALNQALLKESAERLSVFSNEFEYRAPGGPLKWIAIESKPVREPDGTVVWFGYCRDVTENRRLEAERYEQSARWALAAEAGDVGIWEWDAQSGLVSANKRCFAMLGITPGTETLVLREFEALVHAKDLLDGLNPACWQGKAEGATLPAQTVRMRHATQGAWVWVEARCRLGARSERTGEVGRVSGTLIDVTERIERERLRAAHLSAEAANQAKSRFVSRMSHELRTPLSAVMGFAELLEEDPGHTLTDTQHQHVKQVLNAAEYLLGLVDDVLDISQIESNEMAVVLAATPVAPLLDEVVSTLMPMARRQQIQLDLVSCPIDWAVMADRKRLHQVLLNLVSNGIKYNRPRGTVRLTVAQVNSPEEGRRVHIAVSDTGIGIAADRIGRLGEPFNRLGAERSGIAGTGIGLTISKSMLTAMGGHLQVQSTLAEGSVFTAVLTGAPQNLGLLGGGVSAAPPRT